MPFKCNIINCRSASDLKGLKLSYHRLPRCKKKRKAWLDSIGESNIQFDTGNTHICSLHFDGNAFNKTLDVLRLKDDAVPSLSVKVPSPQQIPSILVGTTTPRNDNETEASQSTDFPTVRRICIICLRADRKLFRTSNEAFGLHDELCNYELPTGVVYCTECEHLLKKLHKFYKRCQNSLQTYLKWKRTKSCQRVPLTDLHTLLPPSPLGCWNASSRVACIILNEPDTPAHVHYDYKDYKHINRDDSYESSRAFLPEAEPTLSAEYKKEIVQTAPDMEEHIDQDNVEETVAVIQDHDYFIVTAEDDTANKKKEEHNNKKEDHNIKNEEHNKNNKEQSRTVNDKDWALEENTNGNFVKGDRKRTRPSNTNGNFVKGDRKRTRLTIELEKDNETIEDNNSFGDEDRSLVDNDDHFDEVEMIDDEVQTIDDEVEMIDEEFMKSFEEGDFDGVESCNDNKNKEVFQSTEMNKKPFERLQSVLKEKLASMEQVFASDGTPIDTELVLKSLGENGRLQDLRNFQYAVSTTGDNCTCKLIQATQVFYNRYLGLEKYKTVFDIQFMLTDEMKIEEFEKRKTYECYVTAKHKCELCYIPFKNAKSLENHIKEYHEESPRNAGMFCSLCKIHLGKKGQRREQSHLNTHTAVFKCKLCPLVTYYSSTMKTHYAMHVGKSRICGYCGASFKWSSVYYLHLSKYHQRKQHVCTTCGRGFVSSLALTMHAKTHARDPRPPPEDAERVSCVQCDVSFPSQAVYAAHVWDVHEAPPEPGAPRRRRPYTKKRKTPLMHSVRQVKCKLCNKVNYGQVWIKRHFLKEHPNEDYDIVYADDKKNLCHVCGARFASVYVLRDHMNVHTGALPFRCELCPKRFRTNGALSDHRARHLPPSHVCDVCGKACKSKSNLYSHIQTHTGKKNYKCVICGKCFSLSRTLNEHIRGVHHNIRRVRRPATEKQTELDG